MEEERRALLCPNCGAPLPPGAAHETVTCAFCGIASALAPLTALAERSDLVCPRCETKLFSGTAHDIVMLGCGLCGGIWLDNESARRVTAHFDQAVIELAGRASMNATARPDVRAPVACAVCRNPMTRTIATSANVEIDLRQAHGTWFYAGELAMALAALQAPVPTQMAAPNYEPIPVNDGVDWGGVAGNVAVGAFEVLAAILTD